LKIRGFFVLSANLQNPSIFRSGNCPLYSNYSPCAYPVKGYNQLKFHHRRCVFHKLNKVAGGDKWEKNMFLSAIGEMIAVT